jgi:hypothetical protein
MNKTELMAKIEAMKANTPTTPEPTPQEQKAPTEAQTTPAEPIPAHREKSKLISFKIIWSEATSKHDGEEARTWKEANNLMEKIAKCVKLTTEQGYYKTKICIMWENGYSITDRMDLSNTNGDFNPHKQTIQQYLKPQKSVMYNSNLNQGERDTALSWEDEEEAPQTIPQAQAEAEAPEETAPAPAPAPAPAEQKNNLQETPAILRQLLGIVEIIEESNDSSETALIKAAEQVEKCKAYTLYLNAILPILQAKVNEMIEAKHKKSPMMISAPANHNFN